MRTGTPRDRDLMSTHSVSPNASIWSLAGQTAESEPVRHIPLTRLPFRVGRRSDLALSLSYRAISKEHAEVFEEDGRLWIRDLHSTNGTYVNGVRVVETSELEEGDLVQFATVVFRVSKEESNYVGQTVQEDTSDQALAMIQFDRLITENGAIPFFQPIVETDGLKTIGYEVLGRSRLFGLMNPSEMFNAASQLSMESELSRVFRRQGISFGKSLSQTANLFLNTHPVELSDDALFESLYEIRSLQPSQPITLEIHEAAITDTMTIRTLKSRLEELDMQLAYDDFGSGQARLVELTEIPPDYIKFDMQLVRGIDHASPSRQQFVASLVSMVADLGVIPLAEGVETTGEHDTCRQLGFVLGQGYHYGKPMPAEAYTDASRG